MFQYATRRMGGTNRWWRRRRLSAHTPVTRDGVLDTSSLGALVPADDPPAVFTSAEDAEVAEGHSSQRTIEAAYNRKLTKRLGRLASTLPDLERRKVHQLHVADHAHDVEHRLRRAERAQQAMRDHGRHLPRFVRVLLVLVLAAVDVIAYRAAVEVAFDTSDEWPAILDSYLLALLSLGMVMAAMFAAEQLKTLHTARDRRVIEPAMADDDQRHARRVWLQAGVPALVCAIALLVAGSMLRVNALAVPPRWFWLAVPAFSASAAIGAFFVEYKWANKALDERDDLERRSNRVHRRLRRADRKLAASEGEFRMREAEITQLWSLYEPSWRVQLEMAAARIASARAANPELFHPLGRSVVESVHERIARGTTRRDGSSRTRPARAHGGPGARTGPHNATSLAGAVHRSSCRRRPSRDRRSRPSPTRVRGCRCSCHPSRLSDRRRPATATTGRPRPRRRRRRRDPTIRRDVATAFAASHPAGPPALAAAPPGPAGGVGNAASGRRRRPYGGAVADHVSRAGVHAGLVPAAGGERTTGARCWMVVIDESSSMSSADSLGTRADAVRATAEFLAAYGVAADRIGVTWFADDAEVTPAVPTDDFVPPAATLRSGAAPGSPPPCSPRSMR